MKNVFIGLIGIGLSLNMACNNTSSSQDESTKDIIQLEGNWIEIMPVNKQIVQGICIESGGKASSIGMHTLKYESWKHLEKTNQLILNGKSIGNGITIEFSDTFNIVNSSPEQLSLGKTGAKGIQYKIEYQKVDNIEKYQKEISGNIISDGHNAENSLDYEGTYKGTIPAADCPGINVTLIIRKDNTFHLTYDYIERDSKFESNGRYFVKDNFLITIGEKNDSTFYKLEENRIRLLDYQKQVIKGKLEQMYILKKEI